MECVQGNTFESERDKVASEIHSLLLLTSFLICVLIYFMDESHSIVNVIK